MEYDVFICHASEDKDSFVRELAEKLLKRDLKVWYDDFTLFLGDSLRRSIDDGLAKSRYGVVILSKKFFEKKWPQKELNGLVARENERGKVILPIWQGVTKEQVSAVSPLLADCKAASTDMGIDYVIIEILKVVSPGQVDQNKIMNEIKEQGGADLGKVEEIARDLGVLKYEVDANQNRLQTHIRNSEAVLKKLEENDADFKIDDLQFDRTLYSAVADKIGLLDPKIGETVVQYYTKIKLVEGEVSECNKEYLPNWKGSLVR